MLPTHRLCSLQLAEGRGLVVFLGFNTLHMGTVSLDPLQLRLVSYHGALGSVAFSSWDIHFDRVTW